MRDEHGGNGIYWRFLNKRGPIVDPVERREVARAIKAVRRLVQLIVWRLARAAVRRGIEDLARRGLLSTLGGDDAGA